MIIIHLIFHKLDFAIESYVGFVPHINCKVETNCKWRKGNIGTTLSSLATWSVKFIILQVINFQVSLFPLCHHVLNVLCSLLIVSPL